MTPATRDARQRSIAKQAQESGLSRTGPGQSEINRNTKIPDGTVKQSPGKGANSSVRAILVGAALWHRRSNREEYRVSSGVVSNQPQGSIKWIYRSLAGWSWTRADTTDSLANVITCGFHADPLDCSPRVQSMEPPTAAVSTASDEHPACTSGITFSCRVFQIHSSKAEPAEVHGFFFSCLFSGFLLDFPWRPRSICHERYSALQR